MRPTFVWTSTRWTLAIALAACDSGDGTRSSSRTERDGGGEEAGAEPDANAIDGGDGADAASDDAPDATPSSDLDASLDDADASSGAGPDSAVDARVPATCDAVEPSVCPSPSPTFANVKPIIDARCLSCHDGSHEQWPLTSYRHLVEWADSLQRMTLDCSMPPPDSGITMPASERQVVLEWLLCGMPQ